VISVANRFNQSLSEVARDAPGATIDERKLSETAAREGDVAARRASKQIGAEGSVPSHLEQRIEPYEP
jgi:hypothetical protein